MIKEKIVRLAHNKVYRAVRSGSLYKSRICYICKEDNQRTHGHHEDYSKLLEVIWLCPKCHWAAHKQIKLLNIDILACSDNDFELLIKILREQSI